MIVLGDGVVAPQATALNFKKTKGYSEFEITQKREALENVLVPYSEEENKKMMTDTGFIYCETLFVGLILLHLLLRDK